MDLDLFWKESLGYMQDFAAVCSVAVFREVYFKVFLEAVVVALGRVGGGCCETPAHVLLA